MRCSYSRRRLELYRDFSLDIPNPASRQPREEQEEGGEGGGQGRARDGGDAGLESLLEGFFQPSVGSISLFVFVSSLLGLT